MAPEPEYYRPVPLNNDPGRAGRPHSTQGRPFGGPAFPQPVINVVGGKSLVLAYVLWFFLGWLGVHKFYLRQPVWGLIYLLLGGLGFGLASIGVGLLFLIPWALLMFLDIFTMPFRTAYVNAAIARTARPY